MLGTVMAQNIETLPYIEVTGNAKMEVVPNQIYIQIIIRPYTDGSFKVSIAEQESKMKNMFKIAGIDVSSLNTEVENVNFVSYSKKAKENINEKKYYLTVSSLNQLTSAYHVLNDLNIKDVRVTSASHSNIDNLKQEVKALAVQDAKAQACAIFGAFGNKISRPLFIKDNELTTSGGEVIEDEFSVQIKKVVVQSSVFARFAVE
jgi:uncharacterized protein YggE